MNQAKTGFDSLTPQEQKDLTVQIQLGITPEKHQEMKDYAKRLCKKFPKYSNKKLTQITADHFKIKLTKPEK